jgi:lysyl-tRNA synthetase class 2
MEQNAAMDDSGLGDFEAGSQVLQARIKKALEMKAAGRPIYPNSFFPADKVSEIRAAFGDKTAEELESTGREFKIAGRLMARRDYGKSVFFDLKDSSGKIHIYARLDRLGQEKYDWARDFDIGDIIGLVGTLFKTRTGELTILVSHVELVTKNVFPLAEKFHDMHVELRYRRRYLDLIMNDASMDVFLKRLEIIRIVREIMHRNGYMEVETPMLVPIASGANARKFETFHNALRMPLYLRIAPELHLKRLLVGGFDRVFEINKNFRNEGMDTAHNPEFTMMEFYRSYAVFSDLLDFTEELCTEVTERILGSLVFSYQSRTVDMTRPWARYKFHESLVELGGVPEIVLQSVSEAHKYLESLGVEFTGQEPLGKYLAKIFDLKVEPKLQNPTFITHYPTDISPLARRSDDNPSLTDRFELFVAGSELGNAFSELNDPFDQRVRFLRQMEEADEEKMEIDEDYVRALMYGMPPAAGEGIGIDRLVMLLTDSASISDVLLFPHMRPEDHLRGGRGEAASAEEGRPAEPASSKQGS